MKTYICSECGMQVTKTGVGIGEESDPFRHNPIEVDKSEKSMKTIEEILEEFDEKFYDDKEYSEYDSDGVPHRVDYVYTCVKTGEGNNEIKSFLRQAIEKARLEEETKWRKILNSGKRMYEMGRQEERERIEKELLKESSSYDYKSCDCIGCYMLREAIKIIRKK